MMVRFVLLHPGKETGGNLFGLWTDNREAVLHVVLGPAIGYFSLTTLLQLLSYFSTAFFYITFVMALFIYTQTVIEQ